MYDVAEYAHHEPVTTHAKVHGDHHDHNLSNDDTVAQYPVDLDLHQESTNSRFMEPHYEGSGIYADHEHTMSHQPWHMYG